MDPSEIDEPLLGEKQEHSQKPHKRSAWTGGRTTSSLLLVSNVVLLILLLSVVRHQEEPRETVTKFAGLAYNKPVMYSNWTKYQDSNLSIVQKLWDDIDITPLEVMFDDAEADALGLDRSIFRFPWDNSRGIYFLKAFHGLHCLKVFQRAFEHLSAGENDLVSREHYYHCLDALRQDLMCSADDTPMPMYAPPDKVGNGQVRQCRDFAALVNWTKRSDRHPCYSRWVDLDPASRIEAYAFCSKDSPYLDVQQAYFAKWGHLKNELPAMADSDNRYR